MTSRLTVHCNGNYRVPVYKGISSSDMGTPEYVGPGNNVTKEYPIHTLAPGEFYFVGAEEDIAKLEAEARAINTAAANDPAEATESDD